MTEEHPRALVVFLVAAAVGLIGGLVYAWFFSPVEFTAVEPSELRPEFRTMYLQLVGASFAVENDWTRAQFRLDALRMPKAQRHSSLRSTRVPTTKSTKLDSNPFFAFKNSRSFAGWRCTRSISASSSFSKVAAVLPGSGCA